MSKICIVEAGKTLELEIDNFPWNVGDYCPKTIARLRKDDSALFVEFVAYDLYTKTVYSEHNSPVNKDSCVELFLQPKPDNDLRYLNFEINADGVLKLGIGYDRFDRILLQEDECKDIVIKAKRFKRGFEIALCIPFEFIQNLFGEINKSDCKMHMNLYKCGDETKYPHYACWSVIETKSPDFHRPEFFGQLFLK